MLQEKSVLIIAPHGLDEVLGCGGTMARHSDAGAEVHVLVLFGDGTGRDAERRNSAALAADILGASSPEFAGLPENRSDAIPLLEVVSAVEAKLRELQADTVYVSHGGNLNIDHATAFRAAATAARPAPGQTVTGLYAYEIASSTDWSSPMIGPVFAPNRFVEVTSVLDKKTAALKAYGEEMGAPPHARSLPAVRALLQSRGASVGVTAAEAYMTVRSVVTE